jgi:6-hydroxycyclohex-1-ene-1-carbonyl-CoA dehydrogenase
MGDVPTTIKQWQMVQPWGKNKETGEVIQGKLEKAEIPVPELKEGEVLVEIAGCGVCHTDLGYFFDMVPTVSKPPLALGHEIAGTVIAGDPAWVGKEVIIPAVMPCRKCILCKTGRGNRCLAQKMPGNSIGVYGGFASHIVVPSVDLCLVQDRKGYALEQLAVVADAATTPYQAAKRADLQPGDNVIIIGATGGVGVYMAQTAKALGAKTVIGIARNPEKLKRALDFGCNHTISTLDKTNKDIVGEWRGYCKANGLDMSGWKIFEVTGASRPGTRPPFLRRQADSGRLRHGQKRIHVLEADGVRRRGNRHVGLSARVLPDRARHGVEQENPDRSVRRRKADEHHRGDIR